MKWKLFVVAELERQIASLYYERSGLSKNVLSMKWKLCVVAGL